MIEDLFCLMFHKLVSFQVFVKKIGYFEQLFVFRHLFSAKLLIVSNVIKRSIRLSPMSRCSSKRLVSMIKIPINFLARL